MMEGWIRRPSRAVLVAASLALAGCAGMGPMADVLMAGGGYGNVSGEVRRVDQRSRVIQVSNWYGASNVRYDNRTRVVYNGRQYPVRSLERGDRVTIEVNRSRRGGSYANRIYVERSVRDARRHEDRRHEDRRHVRLQYVEGRVHKVDQRNGQWVEVKPNRGPAIRVTLPARAGRNQAGQLRRLRRGDFVRLEGVPISRNRVELVRMR